MSLAEVFLLLSLFALGAAFYLIFFTDLGDWPRRGRW